MNHYHIEPTETMPIFRVYIEGRRTSAFIQFPFGKESVPRELYEEAEGMVDKSIF